MLHDIVKKDSTSRSVEVRIVDAVDGTPELGVVYNTSGIDLWYRRELSAKVSITEATLAALTTAWTSGGFLHIGDGYYRLDIPDAAYATGANYFSFGGAVTGMVVIGGRVRLVDFDIELATQPVNLTQMGGVAQSATDLKHFADSGYDPATTKIEGVKLADTITTYTGNTKQTGDNYPRLGAPAGASVSADIAGIQADTDNIQTRIPAALTANGNIKADTLRVNGTAQTAFDLGAGIGILPQLVDITNIPPAVWDEATSSMTGAGTIGKLVVDYLTAIKTTTDKFVFTTANKVDAKLNAASDVVAAVANKIADHILRRTYANARVSSDGDAVNFRSLLGAVGKLVNKWSIAGSTLTVYQEDDTTSTAPGGTQAITGNAAAEPIVELDTT